MRYQAAVPAALLLGHVVAAGCRRDEDSTPRTAATVTPQAVPAAPAESTTLSSGAIGMRSEAQDHFDRSRQAFLNKDMKTAAAELHDAALFLRTREDSATGFAKALVSRSARELDSLARAVATSSVKSEAPLDHVFAHANRAEAERHDALAMRAWSQHQAARTGEELTMTIDHFERAAKDAGIALDSASTAGMTRARSVANELLKGGPAPAGVDEALKELELQLRRFGARVETQRV